MGFFKKSKAEPVSWPKDKRTDALMYRYPRPLKAGTPVVVKGNEVCVLYQHGAVKEIFSEAGRKVLPADGEIYFLSKRQFEGKFGTKQPLTFQDPRFDMVQLQAFGEFKYRIEDPVKFIDEVAGDEDTVNVRRIEDIVRDEIVMALNQALGYLKKQKGLSVVQIPNALKKIGRITVKAGGKSFQSLGMALKEISELYINPPKEVKKAIEDVSRVSAYTDDQIKKRTKLAAADSMRDAASSGGQVNIGRIGDESHVTTNIKDSVVQRSNFGGGGGGEGASGSSETNVQDSVVQRTSIGGGGSGGGAGKISCPNCGASVEKGWVACPACGNKLKQHCPNCGASVEEGWVACPACGDKL